MHPIRKIFRILALAPLLLASGCDPSDFFSTKSEGVNPAFLLVIYANQPYTIAAYSGTLCTSATGSCTALPSTSFYIDVAIGTALLSTSTTATSGSDGKFTLTNTYSSSVSNATRLRLRTAALDREVYYNVARCGFTNLCVTGVSTANNMGAADLVTTLSAPASAACPQFPCTPRED